MRPNNLSLVLAAAIIFSFLAGGYPPPLFAYVMESASYRLQQDSLNFYGGRGTSTSYHLEDTGGEIATGDLSGSNYNLHAGYQQADEIYITISDLGNVGLTPDIDGLTGGMASGSQTVTVSTNANSGYTLQIKADTDPALRNGSYNFTDYSRVGSDPDYNWSISASAAEFGFSPEGADLIDRYLDNGSDSCNQGGGTDTTDKCWDDLTTTNKNVCQSSTHSLNGTDTVIKFRAESGSSNVQESGTYTATITMTAYVN